MHTQEIENNHTHKTVETDYHTNYIILYEFYWSVQLGRVQNHRDYVIVNHRLTTTVIMHVIMTSCQHTLLVRGCITSSTHAQSKCPLNLTANRLK